MGNHKSGTLGKLSRRVRRNTERAMKARGVREKKMLHENFVKAFNLGAEMFKIRILNATAGYDYEATVEGSSVEVAGENHSVDPMSECSLGTSPEPLRHILDASYPVIDPNAELFDRIDYLASIPA